MAKPANFMTMSFELIKIRLIESNVEIPVYKDILRAVSPHFRSAFDGSFREAEEHAISLAGVTEETLRIFLQWAFQQTQMYHTSCRNFHHIKVLPEQATYENARAKSEIREFDNLRISEVYHDSSSVGPTSSCIFDEYTFDNGLPVDSDDMDRLYYDNEKWLAQYKNITLSLLELYIFADKYSVHQLRDDILSAAVGYARAWNWWIDPDEDIIELAYEHLPPSSQFLRYLVMTSAYIWITSEEFMTQIEKLRQMHPTFAFEVMAAYAQKLERNQESADAIPNSCVFHEHIICDQEFCRSRLENSTYIFTSLIDACSQHSRMAPTPHT